MAEFLSEQGRMKFIRPLYRALAAGSTSGRELARSLFLDRQLSYHPVARKMVAADLKTLLSASQPESEVTASTDPALTELETKVYTTSSVTAAPQNVPTPAPAKPSTTPPLTSTSLIGGAVAVAAVALLVLFRARSNK